MPTNKKNSAAHLLLPRSTARGEALSEKLQAAFVSVSCVEFFSIAPPDNTALLQTKLQNIYSADVIILVSVNAVQQLARYLQLWQWPIPKTNIAVTGQSSAASCQAHDLTVTFMPSHTDNSEGLWRTLGKHNWRDKKVLILRAQTGRDFLAEQFNQAGAEVEVVPVYTRKTHPDVANKVRERHAQQSLTHVLLSSISVCEIWQNEIFKTDATLAKAVKEINWLCYGERIAKYWQQIQSSARVNVLARAQDEAIFHAVVQDIGHYDQ